LVALAGVSLATPLSTTGHRQIDQNLVLIRKSLRGGDAHPKSASSSLSAAVNPSSVAEKGLAASGLPEPEFDCHKP
jgi:hypothetical protein